MFLTMLLANMFGGHMISKKLLIMITALACTVTFALAGTGTDALNFLKIKPSARGASIGDGFVAISDDVNAAFYNPAGLTQISDLEFSLMHMIYMAETSYEYASFAMPAGEDFTIGAYVVYLNYGSIAKTTEDINGMYQASTSSYSPNDMCVALSGALKLGEGLSFGLNVKYASESIDTSNITGIMADAGLLTEIEDIKIGASIYNIGTVSADKAPMGVRFGGSTKLMAMEEDDLTVAAGVNYVMASSKVSGSLGAEWNYENFLFLRGSYSLMTDADSLNVGVGVKQDLGDMIGEVAYNFSMLGDLGSAHRISVGVKLGEGTGNYKGKKATSAKKPAVKSTNSSNSKSTLKYYFKKK